MAYTSPYSQHRNVLLLQSQLSPTKSTSQIREHIIITKKFRLKYFFFLSFSFVFFCRSFVSHSVAGTRDTPTEGAFSLCTACVNLHWLWVFSFGRCIVARIVILVRVRPSAKGTHTRARAGFSTRDNGNFVTNNSSKSKWNEAAQHRFLSRQRPGRLLIGFRIPERTQHTAYWALDVDATNCHRLN